MEDGTGRVELVALVDKGLKIAAEKLECLLGDTSLSPGEILKRDVHLGSRLELLARHHVVLTNAIGQI